jgi:hypothetical protein
VVWLAVLLTVALSIMACRIGTLPSVVGQGVRGSGDVVEETREIAGVDGVELATLGELEIEVGEVESLRIEAEDNLLPYLKTEVRAGTLTISSQSGVNLRPTRPVRYFLVVSELESIKLSSSGDAVAPDLEAGRFTVRISSSGDLRMGDLVADAVNIEISSSGSVVLGDVQADTLLVDIGSSGSLEIAGGTVQRQEIAISSSGNYRARGLASSEADVRLTSSGGATIRVSDALTARLSSSGDLQYLGNPSVDARETSSGDVTKIGE